MRSIPILMCLIACAGCTRNPETRRLDYLQRAEAHLSAGRYGDAIITYQNALQIRSDDAATHRRLADAFLKADKPVQALSEFVTAADLEPDNAAAQREVGWMLLRAGEFRDAQDRAESVLRRDSRDSDAMLLRAYALGRIKGLEAGIAAVDEVIALDPSDSRALAVAGWLRLGQGQLGASREALDAAVKLAPESPEIQTARGLLEWADGHESEAESAFRAALAVAPEGEVPNRAMAILLIATGRAPAAEPYVRSVQAVSAYRGGLLAAAWLRAMGRVPEARALLEDLERRERVAADATAQLAALDAADRQYDRALERVKRATEQSARPEWLLLEGRLLLAMGRPADATIVLDRAASGAGDHPRYVFWRGMAARASGQLERAKLFFDRAATRLPDLPELAQQRAELAIQTGDLRGAIAVTSQALRYTNDDAVRVLRARAERLTGDVAAARRTLGPMIAAQTLTPAGHLESGYLAYLRDRDEEAVLEFEQALADPSVRAEAVAALIEVHAKHRRAAEASALLAKVARTPDLDARSYAAVAQGYLRFGRAADAEAAARAGISAKADSAAVRTVLALARYAQGAVDDAREEYRRALEYDPRYGVAANNLAWLELERGDAESARQLALVARESMGDRPEVLNTLGLAYVRTGQPELAVQTLKVCVARAPGRVQYRLDLAEALLLAGRAGESKQILDATSSAIGREDAARRDDLRKRVAMTQQSAQAPSH